MMNDVLKGTDLSITINGVTLIHQNRPSLWLPEHCHEQHEVLIPLIGEFEVSVEEQNFSVKPNQMFWLPLGTKHTFSDVSTDSSERLIILIESELWRKCKGADRKATIFPSHQLIKELAFYLLVQGRETSSDAIVGALLATLSDVLAFHTEISPPAAAKLFNQHVQTAMRILEKEFMDEITIENLASRVGIAPRTLSRLFSEHVGLSPKQVLIRHRVEEACRLLRGSQLTITDVAFESGFGSLSRFIESFRAQVGLLPSDYRARNQS
jgi:AraC-like DNA-binding protein